MINSFEEFMTARKEGSLKTYKVSRRGGASIDPDVMIKSQKVATSLKAINKAKAASKSKA